ncbi:phosphopentomutase [Chelativorans sp. Marseille-P2723]|uniref:phosphopentomutase n=1 Tax=Chelativorans sp. Marseille-P2723 TaxID=2709133 RepID=UPI00156EB463|nr:phosphopentomutase [Chelativorans sp. Marseille-P2723]
MARAFLFILDSFGIGHAADAADFGDEGADTFGHIATLCAAGKADRKGVRKGPLKVPNLRKLGLERAAAIAAGRNPDRLAGEHGFFGAAEELSTGKDTPSGHWEIAGVPVPFEWGYFPKAVPAFPGELTERLIAEAGLPGILGNCHASGTQIIARLGEEHIRTGKPIIYTSADSVFQIAAHETHFGLERLYRLCTIARRLVDDYRIGRVIARPFTGRNAGTFKRTANRRDYAVPPPAPTLLDRVETSGARVIGVGKIGDIFAHKGVTEVRKAAGNMALFDVSLEAIRDARNGDLVFANFVDFDTLYGHRRDVPGYAAALEAFDARLPEALAQLRAGDLLILTADHGCDPTWRGSDHTRERVPILGFGSGFAAASVGLRRTFADIGETVADHLGLPPGPHGTSFLPMAAHA